MGQFPMRNSGVMGNSLSPFSLSPEMDSSKQTDTEEVRRIAGENRKAIERLKEELRRLKERIDAEEVDERTQRISNDPTRHK